jgi:hypothetical protein
MSDISIPNGPIVGAEVNAPAKTLLYHPTLKQTIEADESDVSALRVLGFRTRDFDPEAALSDVLSSLDGAKIAISRYARGVIDDGVIDRSDESAQVAALVAVDAFSFFFRELVTALEAKYPRAESLPALLAREIEKDGKLVVEEIKVDPNQVDAFKAEGWREA